MGGTHTRDTGEREKICCSIPAASFSPVSALTVANQNIIYIKWGRSVAWLNNGANLCSVTCSNFRLCYFDSILSSHIHTRVAGRIIKPGKIKGRGLVQCVSNGACFCSVKFFFFCEPPTVSFCLLTLQASKEKSMLSNTAFSSQNGGVVGEYAQIWGVGPICLGRGGVAWGRPTLP